MSAGVIRPHRDDDPGILDILDLDADQFTEADKVQVKAEEKALAAFLREQMPDPAMRRALARDLVMASWLQRVFEASVFVTGPDEAANYGRAVTQAALKVRGRIAPAVRAAKAGEKSGRVRRKRIAPRDHWLCKQWGEIKATGNAGNAGLLVLRARMRKQGYRPLSLRRLRDIVEPKASPKNKP
jgi:hypothetical protein